MLLWCCSLLFSGLTSRSKPVAEGCEPALSFSLRWLHFPLCPESKLLSHGDQAWPKSKQIMAMCQFSVTVEAGLWLIESKYMDYFWTSFSLNSNLVWQIIHLWLPTIWTQFRLLVRQWYHLWNRLCNDTKSFGLPVLNLAGTWTAVLLCPVLDVMWHTDTVVAAQTC